MTAGDRFGRGSERRKNRLLRRLGVSLLVLLAVLVAAHTLYWRSTEERLEAGLQDWAAEQRAHGWQVRIGRIERSGWPLAARLRASNVSIEGGQDEAPGGLAWSAERLDLVVRLLSPTLLALEPDGAQTLRLSTLPAVSYTADSVRAEVPLEPGSPARRVALEAHNLRLGVPGARGSATVGLLQGRAELHPAAAQGEPAIAFSLTAEAVGLPAGPNWALGGHISSLALDGALNGPLPQMPGFVRRATAWRDGGGSLAIQRLSLGWGSLGLTASATLALDSDLQPIGDGTARVIGYAETLDALAAQGAIARPAATAVKALAALIARTPERGGSAEIEVPLTLQDRMLSIRQIPLARMPELIWPPE